MFGTGDVVLCHGFLAEATRVGRLGRPSEKPGTPPTPAIHSLFRAGPVDQAPEVPFIPNCGLADYLSPDSA